jgi:peptidyl-prolyl cis-trans isomerase SurA
MTMQRPFAALALGLVLFAAAALPVLAAGVRVTVNDTPITDVQISQRARLMQMEHHPGNLTTEATNELINEALELSDARRLNINITDTQVDTAFLSVARNLRISQDKLTAVLGAAGVGIDTLKDRLRATLAFNQISQNIITPRVQFSEADLAKQADAKASGANSYDYILKEVVFVIPGGKGSPGARTGDANRYRAQFKGCDSAVPLSLKFVDAAVTDVGRRHATQMPDAVAAELGKLPVGGITKPRVVQGGVSMLAICSKEEAKDLTFITNQLRQAAGNDQLKGQTDKYLADLKAKAKIVYTR